MIRLLIGTARFTLSFGAVVIVGLSGMVGAMTAHSMGASPLGGLLLGVVLSFIVTAIFFGVAAAILDMHQQVRTMAATVAPL